MDAGNARLPGRRQIEWGVWLLPPLLYLGLVTAYLSVIPLGESPDEPGHWQCVQQVALYNRLPIVEPKPQGPWWEPSAILSGRMCYHMPLYYVLAGLAQKLASATTGTPLAVEFPAYNEAFGETGVMFLHPARTAFWPLAEPASVLAARWISVLGGLAVVGATMGIAYSLWAKSALAAVVAGLWVAGWPQFLFLSRAISNDSLATALAVGVLAWLVCDSRPQRFVGLALLSVLAVLTKVTMLFVVAVVAAGWLLELWHTPGQRRALWRSALPMLGIWGGTLLLVQWTPVLRDHFGSSTRSFSALHERIFLLEYWIEVLRLTLSSGWARFGWMNVAAPDWQAYLWWSVVGLLALGGSVVWWHQKLPRRTLLALLVLLWVAGNLATYLRINLAVPQPQFRFLMSLLPIAGALVAGGLLQKPWPRGVQPVWLVAFLVGGAIGVNLALLGQLVLPKYWGIP